MTGNILLDLLISLAGIAVLVGLARFLFPSTALFLNRDLAQSYLSIEEPDFHPADWFIGNTGDAAISANADNTQFVLLRSASGKIVHRRVLRSDIVHIAYDEETLMIALTDMTFRKFPLIGEDAKAWEDRLGVACLKPVRVEDNML